MSLRCHRILALLGALLLSMSGAGARASAPPSEYLDEQTGATVTVVDKPLVFARERTERAANLRDYVNLTAAAVNRSGKVQYVLIAYVWSTLDERYDPIVGTSALVLVADDRRIRLSANGKTPQDLGIAQPVRAPAGQELKPAVFPTDLDTLRYIAAAHNLAVQTGAEGESFDYELWEDQRAALARFVAYLNGER